MGSGDEIESGRTTTGESTTVLLGAIPSEQDVNFNGTVILAVGPQEGDLHPTDTLNGIIGIGSNPATPPGIPGGIGIIGEGGSNMGTGVLGNGGGGGTGVEANGGKGGQVVFGIDPAGIGLLARGGAVDNTFAISTNRAPHGPGVVASAGASKVPKLAETGNVGVFGQGGDQVDETRDTGTGSPPIIVGPAFAGAGIVGRGGITRGNDPEVPNSPVVDTGGRSAGVVGLAGGLSMPKPQDYSRAGVFGKSDSGAGVKGVSDSGNGVVGTSTEGAGVRGENLSLDPRTSGIEGFAVAGRGGVFFSKKVAQLRLVLPEQPQPPSQIEGLEGDLLATKDEDGLLGLWFCRRASDPGPVDWVRLA